MSNSVTIIIALAVTLFGLGCAAGRGKSTTMNISNLNASEEHEDKPDTEPKEAAQNQQAFPVRGEIKESYQLAPGARVDISDVHGPVDVETVDGSRAEIHLVRMARTKKDYDCDQIEIQNTDGSLVLRHQQDPSCKIIYAQERLKLVVPRSANLSFKNIEGDLTIGVTDGLLRLQEVEGYVKVAGVQTAEMISLEKGLSLTIHQLGTKGVNISRVEGPVELGLSSVVNADLRVSSHSGRLKTEIPEVQGNESVERDYSVRLGSGGARISLSKIGGDIRIHRV